LLDNIAGLSRVFIVSCEASYEDLRSVQAESVFATVAVLTEQQSSVDDDEVEISLEESQKPILDADIWKGLKEETLLDLHSDNCSSNSAAAAI